jgi:hypothetical protein
MLSSSIQSAAPFKINSAAVSRFNPCAKKTSGMSFPHLVQDVQRLRFMPVWAGILRHDRVVNVHAESLDELLWCQHHVRAHSKSQPLEFLQAALDIPQATVHKKDSHQILPALGCIQRRNLRRWIEDGFGSRRHFRLGLNPGE